ncbi:hypothetical protein VP01_2616g2 [Puccinia sorghi]|uniref:C2H2-type domain-containing protein n=1 Tax=Puccinia sorghi TaxID=27349 RepID=A0A0L6V6B0_9BASI|nr:hypothetical protein VP01_2616g2 [Puccinia sorghi]
MYVCTFSLWKKNPWHPLHVKRALLKKIFSMQMTSNQRCNVSTDSSSHNFLFPSYSPLCPTSGEHQPTPASFEDPQPKYETTSLKYESTVKYEPGDNYSFLAFTPSSIPAATSSPPVESAAPQPSHGPHVTSSTPSFPCPPSSQIQLPPLLNSRQEYPQSTWMYQTTFDQSRSPTAEVYYERERDSLPHCLRLNHTATSLTHCLPGPYNTSPPECGYPAGPDYHSLEDYRYNECRPNPHRIFYPTTGLFPYSRPVQHSAIPSERPFPCEKCGARFNRNHDLKRHTRIHLEVKPFPCGWCDKAFSRKDALKRHLMVKACSGSKEVSVEESVRRAEQVRQRRFQAHSPQTRDRKYSLSGDSVSTSESATTCSA